MPYNVPGQADDVSAEVRDAWNELVVATYESMSSLHTRFFSMDPAAVANPVPTTVNWFADPAEPAFCIDANTARALSDWPVRGRHELHNEYCEYAIEFADDGTGRRRPKRLQLTTELREYWLVLATKAPHQLRDAAGRVLGRDVTWTDLYGVADPLQLDEPARRIAFATQCAGHGNENDLQAAGVPVQPMGALNRANALFMTHPINGLDDLLYIVLFGAQPYARRVANGWAPATKEQIFRHANVQQLACRHADPAAATAAHAQAFQGRSVAFADPLGMYINTYSFDAFVHKDAPLPDHWIRPGRGSGGLNQRLVFGPPDDEPYFLDDIRILEGDSDRPLTGGYDVARCVEVGPHVLIGDPTPVTEDEYVPINKSTAPIKCSEAQICGSIRRLKEEWDGSHTLARVAHRTMVLVRTTGVINV